MISFLISPRNKYFVGTFSRWCQGFWHFYSLKDVHSCLATCFFKSGLQPTKIILRVPFRSQLAQSKEVSEIQEGWRKSPVAPVGGDFSESGVVLCHLWESFITLVVTHIFPIPFTAPTWFDDFPNFPFGGEYGLVSWKVQVVFAEHWSSDNRDLVSLSKRDGVWSGEPQDPRSRNDSNFFPKSCGFSLVFPQWLGWLLEVCGFYGQHPS